MKFLPLIPVAVSLLTGAAHAASTTYTANFSVTGIPGSLDSIFGGFIVTLDPETLPYVNDAVPTQATILTSVVGFDESFTRVDFYPFSAAEPGFLIGWSNGSTDINNALLSNPYDFRIRFILDNDYNLISARGVLRYFNGAGYSVSAFDTALGVGSANWSIDVDAPGGSPAIPEPATWAMMIAGFGLVGGVARRRREMLRSAC